MGDQGARTFVGAKGDEQDKRNPRGPIGRPLRCLKNDSETHSSDECPASGKGKGNGLKPKQRHLKDIDDVEIRPSHNQLAGEALEFDAWLDEQLASADSHFNAWLKEPVSPRATEPTTESKDGQKTGPNGTPQGTAVEDPEPVRSSAPWVVAAEDLTDWSYCSPRGACK